MGSEVSVCFWLPGCERLCIASSAAQSFPAFRSCVLIVDGVFSAEKSRLKGLPKGLTVAPLSTLGGDDLARPPAPTPGSLSGMPAYPSGRPAIAAATLMSCPSPVLRRPGLRRRLALRPLAAASSSR